MLNKNLGEARNAKNDEFYTQYEDIQKEVNAYLEYNPDVYELLDLDIGKCRMAVAAKKGFSDNTDRTLRVATKFSNIAQQHYLLQLERVWRGLSLRPFLRLDVVFFVDLAFDEYGVMQLHVVHEVLMVLAE